MLVDVFLTLRGGGSVEEVCGTGAVLHGRLRGAVGEPLAVLEGVDAGAGDRGQDPGRRVLRALAVALRDHASGIRAMRLP